MKYFLGILQKIQEFYANYINYIEYQLQKKGSLLNYSPLITANEHRLSGLRDFNASKYKL